jgi:hypothetical protein
MHGEEPNLEPQPTPALTLPLSLTLTITLIPTPTLTAGRGGQLGARRVPLVDDRREAPPPSPRGALPAKDPLLHRDGRYATVASNAAAAHPAPLSLLRSAALLTLLCSRPVFGPPLEQASRPSRRARALRRLAAIPIGHGISAASSLPRRRAVRRAAQQHRATTRSASRACPSGRCAP